MSPSRPTHPHTTFTMVAFKKKTRKAVLHVKTHLRFFEALPPFEAAAAATAAPVVAATSGVAFSFEATVEAAAA